MSVPRVLLLGGHGKVALHLTPLLLAKSWDVTSVIRDPKQQDDILELGKGQKGRIDVLVESLEDVKSDADAKRVLDKVKPDYVVWSAGESSILCLRTV
jgi:nucleoside-diphosphate-sugar epimerase